MPEKRWPTIQAKLDQVAQGIIDETSIAVPPYGDAMEQIRADLEAFKAQQRLAREPQPTVPESSRRPA